LDVVELNSNIDMLRLETFLRLGVDRRETVNGVEELGSSSLGETDGLEVGRELGEREGTDQD
jgi:hypothetical protein